MLGIACDHAGFKLKDAIKQHFSSVDFLDFGTHSEQSVDYPDFAKQLAASVVSGKCSIGILICGTGVGISIAANKIKGIRCALCTDTFTAEATRKHNNSNVLALGARVLENNHGTSYEQKAFEIVQTFLNTQFEGGRHQARIDKIEN